MSMFLHLTLIALLALAGVPYAHSADMTKTVRVAFAVAENGFDPHPARTARPAMPPLPGA
jgi:hypothetical protein